MKETTSLIGGVSRFGIGCVPAIAILIGLYFLISEFRHHVRSAKTHAFIEQRCGFLAPPAASSSAVVRVATKDPHDFVWQMRIDRYYQRSYHSVASSMTWPYGNYSPYCLCRLRFDFSSPTPEVHQVIGYNFFNKDLRRSVIGGDSDSSLLKFVGAHWVELDVETLPAGKRWSGDLTESLSLLSVRLPDRLRDDFRLACPDAAPLADDGELLSFRISRHEPRFTSRTAEEPRP